MPAVPTANGRHRAPLVIRILHAIQIAIPVFPRITALDVVGPYDVLQRLPGSELVFIGHELGNVRTENGFLGLAVDALFEAADGCRNRVFAE